MKQKGAISKTIQAYYPVEETGDGKANGYIIGEEVGGWFDYAGIMEWLRWIVSEYEEIDLHLNTPGGDITQGIAIRYALLTAPQTINTTAVGLVASMGVPLHCLGAYRRGVRGSLFLIHQGMMGGFGLQADQLKEDAKMLEGLNRNLAAIIAEACAPEEVTQEWVLENWMRPGVDTYLTMEEALKYGLIHEIIDETGLNLPVTEGKPSKELAAKVTASASRFLAQHTESFINHTTMNIEKLRAHLGLPANATAEEIVDKAIEAISQADEARQNAATAALGPYVANGTIEAADRGMWEREFERDPKGTTTRLVAKAGATPPPTPETPPAPTGATPEAVVKAYVGKGLTLAQVPSMEAWYEKDAGACLAYLAALKPHKGMAEGLRGTDVGKGADPSIEGKTYMQIAKDNPGYLKALKESDPEKWNELYNAQFK